MIEYIDANNNFFMHTLISFERNPRFKFRLTGSFYFHGKGDDLDFFVEDSKEVRLYLDEFCKANGYISHFLDSYIGKFDCVTQAVLRIYNPQYKPYNFEIPYVDIQLVNDVDAKINARLIIKRLFNKNPKWVINKFGTVFLWNLILENPDLNMKVYENVMNVVFSLLDSHKFEGRNKYDLHN